MAGNIRQLHNVIETAVLLAPSNQISINELPEEIRKSANREGYFTVFSGFSARRGGTGINPPHHSIGNVRCAVGIE
jgi:DNA-binding NtrC family response regulator